MLETPTPDFKKLFESSPNPYLVLQPDLKIVAVSDAYLKATMTSREKILGRGIFDVFPDNPEDLAATGTDNLRSSIMRAIQTKTADTMAVQKYDVRRPESEGGNYEVRYWSPINTPILDNNGEVIYVIHRVEDVTEFMRLHEAGSEQGKLNEQLRTRASQMEADIYQRSQELQEANQQLRKVNEENDVFFSVSLDMLCISGFDGYFKKVNPAFHEALGFTEKEICSNPFLYFIHPEDVEKTRRQVEEQLSNQKPVISFENRYRCKDGTYKKLSWKSTPVGSLMYAVARNITERQVFEDRMHEANRLKTEFLANMSHELRTPLNAIIGFTSLMHEDKVGPVSNEQKEFLGDILVSSKHLLQLINDILDLAKVEAGKIEFYPERFELAKVINEVKDVLRGLAFEKRIEITVKIHPAIKEVNLDPGKFKQVLYNFLSNAIKFTNLNGQVFVRTSLSTNGMLCVDVEDNGIGIKPEDLSKLFVEFQQLDSGANKRHQGTGLGLALTKRLVEAQGGVVKVKSVLGSGTTFSAILPMGVE